MRPTAHLLWKEATPLLPLALVLGLTVVATRMIDAGIGEAWLGSTHSLTLFFGVLAPFAFALGAAALLLTQEFELGTMYWLRSQPVTWRRVLSVKLAVSLLGLVGVWGVTLLCWAVDMRGSLLADEPAWTAAWGPYLALNSLQVLFWAFLAALIGRGSLTSLFLVIPAAFVSMTVAWSLAAALSGASVDAGDPGGEAGGALLVVLALFSLLLLTGVFWIGSRRLVASGRIRQAIAAPQESAIGMSSFYRPPAEAPRHAAPGPLRALLWHHAMSWPGVRVMLLASVIGTVVLVSVGVSMRSGVVNWQFPIGVFAAIILAGAAGASAMAPENERGRQRFFADRGISPTAVWASRLVLPVLILLPLCTGAMLIGPPRDPQPEPLGTMALLGLLSAFVAGILAGQFAARPVVGLLSGALLGLIAAGVAGFFMSLYPTGWWAYLPALLIMFGLSWRHARRWLDDRHGWGVYGRAGGWLTAAAAIVLGVIVPARLSDLPDVDEDWLLRQAMAQQQEDLRLAVHHPVATVAVDPDDSTEWIKRLRQGPLGERFERLNRYASSTDPEEVVPGATAADFLRAHRPQLDEIVAEITRAERPVELSSASWLALRLGADGALEMGERDRAIQYLAALLHHAHPQGRFASRPWAISRGLQDTQRALELLDELESLFFGTRVSADARDAVAAALHHVSYRRTLRSQLLRSWQQGIEMIEAGEPADIEVYQTDEARFRLSILPWEQVRSRYWLSAATEKELQILDPSLKRWVDLDVQGREETIFAWWRNPARMKTQERMMRWHRAAGMGGPGVESLDDERLVDYPTRAVDLATAADQRIARFLKLLERTEAADE